MIKFCYQTAPVPNNNALRRTGPRFTAEPPMSVIIGCWGINDN